MWSPLQALGDIMASHPLFPLKVISLDAYKYAFSFLKRRPFTPGQFTVQLCQATGYRSGGARTAGSHIYIDDRDYSAAVPVKKHSSAT